MTNHKSGLIGKLGTLFLGVTGLVSLAGCEAPQGNRNVSPYAQSQEIRQKNPYDENAGEETLRLFGAIGGAAVGRGLIPLPSNMNPSSRVAAESLTRGAGDAVFASSTKPRTDVKVIVNGSYEPAQPQLQTQKPENLDERLLPEYNIGQLKKEYLTTPEHAIGIHTVFVSSNFLDLNGDGVATIEEFNGLRRNRKVGERTQINTAITTHNANMFTGKPRDYTFSVLIFDEDGKQVYEDIRSGSEKKFTGSKVIYTRLPELNPGVYKVECEYKDKEYTSKKGTVFQVLEDK